MIIISQKMEKAQHRLDFFDSLRDTRLGVSQTVEKPQFCIRQNWGFERIVAKI